MPGYVDPEVRQRRVELVSTTTEEPRRVASQLDRVTGGDEPCRFVGDCAADENPSSRDCPVRLLAAGEQATPHELTVEPAAR
jgi:hypothetical protein